ncbi:unnamed protein product [Caenorhabditis angaria]|uniref:Alpha-1,3-mannosyl-glycoprotein 2-beta-N-acetylglucosaminyltransferase n=1 Tax=Caenorhabditis angaria TaxID=860376 RepID=A0A9P1NA05_9PELO|nr:unnamed protein product [Caenorhabditis angaria]
MQLVTKVFIGFAFLFILWTLYVENDIIKNTPKFDELDDLMRATDRLERLLKFENEHMKKLEKELKSLSGGLKEKYRLQDSIDKSSKSWKEPIPVLVFSCNRASAVREHVKKLLNYRPSKELFPVIVTQDCDNEAVKNEIKNFGDDVQYIKHIAGDKAKITIPMQHRMYTAYYRIARHYKLALDYVFNTKKYTSVIITEDDLDISPDFFSFFLSTRYLMREDPKLWCVSAWNDNGKRENIDIEAYAKLYRSDFFPGLGWMMSSDTWNELSGIWPVGFWDDWMRDPLRRKDRQCIRPEISRTGMTNFGKEGASKGQFFNKHLAKIVVNKENIDFSKIDLDYLLPANFERMFKAEVLEEADLMDISEVTAYVLDPKNKGTSIRVVYTGNIDYIEKADKLHIMHDFKAGVPRTAYDGIVTCFINGVIIQIDFSRVSQSCL